MEINERFGRLADDETIKKTADALKANGVNVIVAESGEIAKRKIFEILPAGAEIMNMNSTTLVQLGVDKEIAESGKYKPVKKTLETMGDSERLEKKRLGAAHEWATGSVHAISEDGSIFIASATGSQLPGYAFGADNVLWVVGAQKLVKNFEDAIKRLYEYCLPLENERAMKAYGFGSGVNKILIINKEKIPGRLNMIIVKEKLGF